MNTELTLKDFKRIEEHIQLRNFNQGNYFVGEEAYIISDQLSGVHLLPLDPTRKTKVLDLTVFIKEIENAVDSFLFDNFLFKSKSAR